MALFASTARQESDGYLSKTPMLQYLLVSLCFPMWGAAAALNDILITQFKAVFTLSDVATAFVQSAFYGGYFVMAIPASRIIRRTSYKVGIMVGLSVYIIGGLLFFPASTMATYTVFLAALFALAIGLSFLETSCNTYSTMLGPRRLATLRLNISQTFYPLGSILGILLGKYLIFGTGEPLKEQMKGMSADQARAFGQHALQNTLLPYKFIVMVLAVMFILVAITQFPHCKPLRDSTHEASATIRETLGYLIHNKRFLQGIGTQFLYVGMQTAVWSFTIRLAMQLNVNINERNASTFMIFSYIAFFVGKFIANLLMAKINPNAVLIGYSALGIMALIYVISVPNMTAVYAAILVSGLFGPCWATIYARTLDTIEDKRHTETGGAVIVMSIVGGAFVPVAQGFVSDRTGSMQISFAVNIVCFAVVLLYFISFYRRERHEQSSVSDLKEVQNV